MNDRGLSSDLDELASAPAPARLPAGVVAELERWVSGVMVSAGLDPSDLSQRRAFSVGVVAGHTSTARNVGPSSIAWVAARPPVVPR